MIYNDACDVDGAEGLPPHIPPNSSLTFDVTLLGYRPRSLWVRHLSFYMHSSWLHCHLILIEYHRLNR